MKITLSQGMFALIDAIDHEKISRFKWCAQRQAKGGFYAIAYEQTPELGRIKDGSRTRPARRRISMHRLILDAPTSLQVDHVNGNGIDNRRKNIRLATSKENAANRRKSGGKSSSRFKGVTWHKHDKKWQATIQIDGHCVYLGQFKSERKAASAYDKAATEHFGAFAMTNFKARAK